MFVSGYAWCGVHLCSRNVHKVDIINLGIIHHLCQTAFFKNINWKLSWIMALTYISDLLFGEGRHMNATSTGKYILI